jgi:hypothetical protein
MSNRNYHYRDPEFKPEQTAGYALLVQVEPGSFSYAITGNKKLLALETGVGLDELENPSDNRKFLLHGYNQHIIALPQLGFTFVPTSLFAPDKVADIARFLDVQHDEKVYSQPLDADNQVIFKTNQHSTAIPKKVNSAFVFPAKGWILAVAHTNPNAQSLYLNIANEHVEILNFREGKLRFYNTFEFRNSDELVYFTSLVAQELGLQNKDITLVVSGEVTPDDNSMKRLAEFFGEVELNSQTLVSLPEEIPSYSVLYLTALSLCGSSEAH